MLSPLHCPFYSPDSCGISPIMSLQMGSELQQPQERGLTGELSLVDSRTLCI